MPANPATPADAERLRQSDAEAAMLTHIRQAGLPEPETEYRFHPKRRWRFDGAYERERVAYEVEGGTWARGRHTRGAGFERDCEKYNAAALLSWRVFRFTTAMVEDGRAVATLELALARCDSGMPKGYKFKRIRCERCGQEVAENWILQHWRSGCTKGGHPRRELETNGAIDAGAQSRTSTEYEESSLHFERIKSQFCVVSRGSDASGVN